MADDTAINTSNSSAQSAFMVIETGADITSRQIIYEQGGQTNGFNVYIYQGDIYVGAWRGGGGTFDLLHSTSISTNTSYVVGFVFDSAGSNSFRGFLNGQLMGSSAPGTDQAAHSGDIGIGGKNQDTRFQDSGGSAGDGIYFSGKFGEIVYYDDVLTDPEIQNTSNYLQSKWSQDIDQLTGGAGDDIFRFDSLSDTGTGAGNRDTIIDFNADGDDTIDLSGLLGGVGTFLGTGAFTSGGTNEVRITQDGANSIIQIDVAGTGTADAEILLQNVTATDIMLSDFIF